MKIMPKYSALKRWTGRDEVLCWSENWQATSDSELACEPLKDVRLKLFQQFWILGIMFEHGGRMCEQLVGLRAVGDSPRKLLQETISDTADDFFETLRSS